MVALKKHDNDNLIKYLHEVLEMLIKPTFEEKELKKLQSLFKIEKILKQEEKKVIAAPQGIHGSTILKTQSYINSMNSELQKLGKNGKATLLYQASKDGHNR